jgi:hypothetical protein
MTDSLNQNVTFTFHRKWNFISSLIGFDIYINGTFVGKLKNGKELKITHPKSKLYLIEIDAPLCEVYYLGETDDLEYNIKILTKGGWKSPAFQSMFKACENQLIELPKFIPNLTRTKDDSEINDAEKTLMLCQEFIWGATDGIDEVLCMDELQLMLLSLNTIGATKCHDLLQSIISDIFENKDLPLDYDYYKNKEIITKVEKANQVWWEAEKEKYMYDEFRGAVASFIIDNADLLF